MKLKTVAPRQGALWVRQGIACFFKQPMAFAGMFMVFLFAAFVLALLPWIGALLSLALLPLVSLGFMIASRTVLEGRFPTPKVFIQPLRTTRARRNALLRLGALYAASTVAILWLSNQVDGGALETLMTAIEASNEAPAAVIEKMSDPRLGSGLALRLGLAVLLAVPFWHAPALVHWGGQSAGKALFFSTVACWRNKGAFLVYGLVWLAAVFLVTMIAFALLGQALYLAVAGMPISLVFSTLFYASLCFTFDGCFAADEPPRHPTLEEGTPP